MSLGTFEHDDNSQVSTENWQHAAHLMVAFQGLGQGVVDDKAHIRLVDAHAKGNGGSDDLHLVSGPVLLHPLTLIWRQASVVVPAHRNIAQTNKERP